MHTLVGHISVGCRKASHQNQNNIPTHMKTNRIMQALNENRTCVYVLIGCTWKLECLSCVLIQLLEMWRKYQYLISALSTNVPTTRPNRCGARENDAIKVDDRMAYIVSHFPSSERINILYFATSAIGPERGVCKVRKKRRKNAAQRWRRRLLLRGG